MRNCPLPIERRDRTFTCAAGHTYDIARSGYVNLLQPQDRRSPSAGDSKAAVEARASLLAAGVGRSFLAAFVQTAYTIEIPDDGVVVDLGSGSGDALGALADLRPLTAVGIDLSTAAAEHAARRFPSLTWVVANADRRLPLLDRSVDLVLSLHGRRNPAECARVLTDNGSLVLALPAPDDLIELRALVQGEGIERNRSDAMLTEHQPFFTLVERSSVREKAALDRDALLNLLHGTYRGARIQTAERVEAIEPMEVTLSSELFVLRKRSPASRRGREGAERTYNRRR